MLKNNLIFLIENIKPVDALEAKEKLDIIEWINSDAPIYRIKKPNIPDKHLIVYFVPYDKKTEKILLVDHINAARMLPPGGHVEIDEDPYDTVKRECKEELGVDAILINDEPLFLSTVNTIGKTGNHIDVCLWYLLELNVDNNIHYDNMEFYQVQWFSLKQAMMTYSDPHLNRFILKTLMNHCHV